MSAIDALGKFYLDQFKAKSPVLPDGYEERNERITYTFQDGETMILPAKALMVCEDPDLVLYHHLPDKFVGAITKGGQVFKSTNMNTDCDYGPGVYASAEAECASAEASAAASARSHLMNVVHAIDI